MRVYIEFSTLHVSDKTVDAIVHLPGVCACHRPKASTLQVDVMLSRVAKTVRDVETLLGGEELRMSKRLEKENEKIAAQPAQVDVPVVRLPPAPPDLSKGFDTCSGNASAGSMVELEGGLVGVVEKRTLIRPVAGGAFEAVLHVRVGKKMVRALECKVRLITGA